MCLPCFTEVFVEEEVVKTRQGKVMVTAYDVSTKTYVKIPKSMVPPQPMIIPQPAYIPPPQPVYQPAVQAPYYMPQIQIQSQPQNFPAGGWGPQPFSIQQPHYNTIGYTPNEMLMQNMGFAQNPDFTKKQEMKPADDDPFRTYWCREQDGTWTQRNRMTIDSGDIGDCRWYAVDGQFYAVRL